MAVNRVEVIWTGTPVAGGGLSTFYFDSAVGTATQQVTAVTGFLTSILDRISNTVTFATVADVATLNLTTGALEGFTSTAPQTGGGTSVGEPLPVGANGLLRLLTGSIVNGRLLRGRLFIPAPTESDNTAGGVPSATYTGDINASAQVLRDDANTNWGVWSRTHGFFSPVATVSTWNKWGLLRSRRD